MKLDPKRSSKDMFSFIRSFIRLSLICSFTNSFVVRYGASFIPSPELLQQVHCIKKVNDFPVPSRDVTNQILPRWEKLNYSWPKRVWLVASRLGKGKWKTFLYSVHSICSNLSLLGAGFAKNISGLIHLYYGLCVQLPCHIWPPEPGKFRNYLY
jgi:hypothetical protein